MFLNDIDKQYIKSMSACADSYKPHWSYSIPSRTAYSQSLQTPSYFSVPTMNIATSAPSPHKNAATPVSGSAAPIDASTWKTGDRVSHRVFGNGSVQRVYHDSVTENDKIEISFDGVGTKTLLLSHAKLERLD